MRNLIFLLCLGCFGCFNPTSFDRPARAAAPATSIVFVTNWIPSGTWTNKAGQLWYRDREEIKTNEVANVTDSLRQTRSVLLLQSGGMTGRSRLTAAPTGSFSNSMVRFYHQQDRTPPPSPK